ncbi:carbohydrate ABC transporter substrate-binding protein [Acetatifactor muris]|uniref:Multiple sugar-binding protein n=1 Tax=Acetatifactor muris TaxID=879566 RepID=A0A2K4ZBZ7_9FIRM|nr:carbohydrate ABC transporter substrate-binding protein [Acetatifactor muris]MCR2046442.1 carbohydrate ABC transporter substrate-binding protein [Acetatifactor muris]SOY27989.1 Multiple sugar-binding protein precursor [Acetatifactor muris]
MKRKKIFAALLAAAMMTSVMTGCGNAGAGSGSDSSTGDTGSESSSAAESTSQTEESQESADSSAEVEEQVLKVAAFEGGYGAEMWSEVAAAFENSHPGVTVELTVDKKLEDVISPGMKAGDYPDVVHLATGREAALTETLTKENALLPLTDVLDMTVPGENVTVKDKVVPGFLDTLATNPYGDGVTYYAPMFYSPCGLFYNAGLFKEKNWEVPTTWEEMWALGDKAKEEGIALFTYPTTGYFDAFTYATLSSAGGPDFFNKCMTYEDGIWESENATKVFSLIEKLGQYTEETTVANANNDNFTKNQQLILDNKAIFCPNGTWLPEEMKDAPRADGFEWGFMAIPAVNDGGAGCSFCWFEQMWIPAAAENQDMAKEFVAYMYSDEAAQIFAKSGAIQPITGVSDYLEGDNKLFYSIYDNGATAVMGGFAATAPVEGVNMLDTLCGTVNSIVSGDKTVAEWQAAVEEASDKLREAME